MNEISRKTADLLLSINAVDFRFDPPFTYVSGITSPIYLDNRLAMSYPGVRRQIVNFYVEVIRDRIGMENAQWISATATAAIAPGALVADRLDVPLIYVRPSAKEHGRENKLEGYLERGAHVVIIEDHVSTAQSVVGNADTVRERGGVVHYAVAATTYETRQSQEVLASAGVELLTLTTGRLLAHRAAEAGRLTLKEKSAVDAWLAEHQ